MLWKRNIALAGAIAALALPVAQAHASDSSSEEMKEMRDMVLRLQDQIEAQQSQLNAQEAVLEVNGLADEGSKSALSSFLEGTDFSGWVATSYTHNTSNNGNNGLAGQNTLFLYPDSSTFSVDQVCPWWGGVPVGPITTHVPQDPRPDATILEGGATSTSRRGTSDLDCPLIDT